MSDLRLSQEARRTCFRAQVVAITRQQAAVTTRDIAAAALRTEEVRAVCQDAGVTLEDFQAVVRAPQFSQVLDESERSLTAKGDWFGSRSHIASLRPLPVTDDMRRAFDSLAETSGVTTPVDLLRAIVLSDPELANELAERGLTASMLRRP
jgi:hypothetical protein